MMIYFDNAATTEPIFSIYTQQKWFNTNANYAFAEAKELEETKEKIKKALNVKSGYVLFTQNASQAAKFLADRLGGIKCFEFEHDSVYKYFRPSSNFYSVQKVNQLTGVVFPDYFYDRKDEKLFYGSDLTSAIGRVIINTNLDSIYDALWWSGHKFHCAKNIGGLWISDRLFNYLGGNKNPKNQYGLIHGTVDNISAGNMAWAMDFAQTNCSNNEKNWYNLTNLLMEELGKAEIKAKLYTGKEFTFYGHSLNKTYGINLITFDDINADALQQYLAGKNIYIGLAQSACSEEKNYRVTNALRIPDNEAEKSIRISFCYYNRESEIIEFVQAVKDFRRLFV